MLGLKNTRWTWFLGIACTSVNTLFVSIANAQITPDTTLPNNSDVNKIGNINKIEGGTTAGGNLFHSFKEFSIPTGSEAHFNNAVDISNIITRVTGKSISNIDGLIKANGTANLFLINPSGIVFGENAKLDIGGSFVGSTADAIGFGEDDFFSASNPESSSLLQVNPNALFFNQVKAAAIQNNSVADAGLNASQDFTVRGLRVPDGKSLLLVGGDINMDGGGLYAGLSAFGGRVELGGLATKGTVGLNGDGNNLSLSFVDGVDRSDVSLSNLAVVNVTAGNGGSVVVNARNLKMTDNSLFFAGIGIGLGSDNSKAGNINVNVTEAIDLEDGGRIINTVLTEANGKAGDVNINTSTLRIIDKSKDSRSGLFTYANEDSTADGGNIAVKTKTLVMEGTRMITGTLSKGNGGNLTVETNTLQMKNAQIITATYNKGNGGNLTIKTDTLEMRDSQMSAGTFAQGNGGDLTIDAQDVQVIGEDKDIRDILFTSGFLASAQPNSSGNAGNLIIKTNTLILQGGAKVSAFTFGKGKGGDLSINAQYVELIKDGQLPNGLNVSTTSSGEAGDLSIKTNTLLVKNGAQVLATTYGEGKGGNLTVDAQDVQLIGASVYSQARSTLNVSTTSSGEAGDLSIKTNTLQVENRAEVSVESVSIGSAGNLTINADSIRLNNDAVLTANTQSPKIDPETPQATININSQDLILRRGSNIFTNAQGENVVGGNININSGVIAAIPNENSDISANSQDSRGGNIRIQSQGIYGTQFRDELTPKSDITATGANPDLSGFVEIITPDINPNSGLVNLPTISVETEVAQVCAAGSPVAQSKFEITELSGLPTLPSEALTTDAVLVDLVTLKPEVNQNPSARVSIKPSENKPRKIVEATGFMKNQKGEVFLVADANGTNGFGWNKNVGCGGVN